MSLDRLQAAWPYIRSEVLRPTFKQFESDHEDLVVAVVRTMLVRPAGMRRLFHVPGTNDALDRLLADRDTFIDSSTDARAALTRTKPDFFLNGRAVGTLLSEIPDALSEYENAELNTFYIQRLERFIEKHMLPYRLDTNPVKLTPLLPGEIDRLYRKLMSKAADVAGLREALEAFEDAWDRQALDWGQINAKDAIRAAYLLAEGSVIMANGNRRNEYGQALALMRHEDRFPNNDFANIFDRAATFVNQYPNIRHQGNAAGVKRDLKREDAILSALVFIGLSACADDLCEVG